MNVTAISGGTGNAPGSCSSSLGTKFLQFRSSSTEVGHWRKCRFSGKILAAATGGSGSGSSGTSGSSGGGEGWSGRDFLAEFDELFKSKPPEEKSSSQQTTGRSGLANLFKKDVRPGQNLFGGRRDASGKMKLDLGTFRRPSIPDEVKPKRGKKERNAAKFFSDENNPQKLETKAIIDIFKMNEVDTGSDQVRVAILTQKIKYLSEHLKIHKKDFASRRGLIGMVNMRRRHLKYLRKEDMTRYMWLIEKLGLKDNVLKTADSSKRGR